MTTFDSFKAEWLNRRVGDSLLIGRGETAETMYQCMSLWKQYQLETKGIRVDWPGNAIDQWYQTPQATLSGFTKHNDGSVQKGDGVIFHTKGYNDDTQPGHIGIATGNGDPNSIEVLEQNAVGSGTGLGRDAISTRFIARNRLAGVLRPIPTPPPPPINPVLSHEAINQVRMCNKQPTNWYNLNGTTFEAVASSISGTKNYGDLFPIGGVIHHIGGQAYAMSPEDYDRFLHGDRSTFNGINIDDLSEYVPPAPAPTPVIPQYVPPKAPEPIPLAQKTELLTTIKYYGSAADALNDVNALGTLNRGKYFIHGSDRGMVLIHKDNMDNSPQWINPRHNVIEAVQPVAVPVPPVPPKLPEIIIQPEPQPVAQSQPEDLIVNGPNTWRSEAQYIFDDKLPITLQSTNTIPVKIKALDGKLPATIDLPAHRKLELLKRIPYNGVEYYQDTMLVAADRFYALPAAMFPDPYEVDKQLAKGDINRDGDVNFSDFVDYGSRIFKSGVAVMHTVAKTVNTKNIQTTRKVIDGFSKAVKKRKIQ